MTNIKSEIPTPKRILRAAVRYLCSTTALFLTLATAGAAELHDFTINKAIPDGSFSGISDTRAITSSIDSLSTVRVSLNISGEFNGDLFVYLRHAQAGRTNFVVLANRLGRTAANSFGYADAGLNVTFDPSAASGDIHLYQSTTAPAAGSPLTGTWQPDGRRTDPLLVTDTSPRDTSLSTFNGAPGGGTWTLFVADVDSGGSHQLVSWALELEGRAIPAITWNTPADITYGTPLSDVQLNASSPVAGTFIYTPAADTILNAGDQQTLSVTFRPDDTATYLPVTQQVSIDVLKKALTATANNAVKLYGATVPTLSFAYSGFVNSDDVSDLATPPIVATTATETSGVGTYPITVSAGDDENYAFIYVNGTLTINAAATSLSIASSANPALPGATVTFSSTVTIVPAGAGAVNGAVQFKVDGANAGPPVDVVNGVATYAMTLGLGTHTVVAEYTGSANLTGSTATLTPAQLINTPPVAAADTIDRWPSNGVKVAISKLLSNDSDADGDSLTLQSVNSPTVNGGSVVVNGGWIIYTPAADFTGHDTFTYTISDGSGAPVMATVTVALKPLGGTSNLEIVSAEAGHFIIRVNGVPGYQYRVQYAEAVDAVTWQDLGSGVANDSGYLEFSHDQSEGAPQLFYRALSP